MPAYSAEYPLSHGGTYAAGRAPIGCPTTTQKRKTGLTVPDRLLSWTASSAGFRKNNTVGLGPDNSRPEIDIYEMYMQETLRRGIQNSRWNQLVHS
jgi:hypothetical protein